MEAEYWYKHYEKLYNEANEEIRAAMFDPRSRMYAREKRTFFKNKAYETKKEVQALTLRIRQMKEAQKLFEERKGKSA